jgi:hypothetical protein
MDILRLLSARLRSNLHMMNNIRIENPYYFYASFAAALGVALISAYLIYRDHVYVSNEKKPPATDDDMEFLGDGKDFFGKQENQHAEGETEKYAWRQTDEELELFVFLPKGQTMPVGKRDIVVKIQPQSLFVSVKDEVIINDKLCGEVVSSDSSWQIVDDQDRMGRTILLWITLFKRQATEPKDYWPGILVKDVKPLVHVIDSEDAINKAIADIKKRK